MGSWLRNLSGHRRYLQQEATFEELEKEYPELMRRRSRSKIPDPWDDFPRKDVYNCSWKRHRKQKYRVKDMVQEPKPARSKDKIIYDTYWVTRARGYFRQLWTRYRVRESYRRHRVDK